MPSQRKLNRLEEIILRSVGGSEDALTKAAISDLHDDEHRASVFGACNKLIRYGFLDQAGTAPYLVSITSAGETVLA